MAEQDKPNTAHETDLSNAPKEPSGRSPDYTVYNVQQGAGDKTYWNRVGVAWEHRDGEGHDAVLDSLPVDGRLTFRKIRDQQMNKFEAQAQALAEEQEHQEQARTQEQREAAEQINEVEHGHARER